MRIKFGNCTAQEVGDTLKLFEDEYNMEFTSVNLYCSLVKGSHLYKFYDLKTNDEAVINAGNNILLQKHLANLACVDKQDMMFLQKVSNLVDKIDSEYMIELLEFLCQLLEVKPNNFELNRLEYGIDEIEIFNRRVKGIMDTIGICPPKLTSIYRQCERKEKGW